MRLLRREVKTNLPLFKRVYHEIEIIKGNVFPAWQDERYALLCAGAVGADAGAAARSG